MLYILHRKHMNMNSPCELDFSYDFQNYHMDIINNVNY